MSNAHAEYPASFELPPAFKKVSAKKIDTSASEKVVDGVQFFCKHQLIQVGTNRETERRLSADQFQALLYKLQIRFDQTDSCRSKDVTFADVRKILQEDPERAYRVHAAEVNLGAEMCYEEGIDGKKHFTDLKIEVNILRQIAFLQSLPHGERELAIKSLRNQYPTIPTNAFDRSSDDTRGPNKWEGKLIEMVLHLKSIPKADYRALQERLPKEQWLDIVGIVWLEEESEAQLASGVALYGGRNEHGFRVCESGADNRCGVSSVRVRA